MNLVLDPLLSVARSSKFLGGGRTQICWSRDLARLTAPMAALTRICSWVGEFAQVHPAICDQPLLGHSLILLTAESALPPLEEPRPPRSQSRQVPDLQRSFGRETGVEKRNVNSAGSSRSARTNALRVTPETPQEPPGVSPLQRRTNPRLPHRAAVNQGAAAGRRPLPSVTALSPEKRNMLSPAFSREQWSPKNWLEGVALRAGRMLRQELFRMATVTPAPDYSATALLLDQWTIPLAGPTAAAALLEQFANPRPMPGDSVIPPKLKRAKADLDVATRSLPVLSGLPGQADNRVSRKRNFATETRPGSKHLESDGLPEQYGPRIPADVNSWQSPGSVESSALAVGYDNARPSPLRIAPPTLTPSLAPLRSPPASGEAVLPIGAITARQGARAREAVAQGDDLNVLAVQIKRILDEDARRHGIDV